MNEIVSNAWFSLNRKQQNYKNMPLIAFALPASPSTPTPAQTSLALL
jgi:hypothetical protein